MFLADEPIGLHILDASTIPPTIVGALEVPEPRSIAVAGGWAYLGCASALLSVDVSDPSLPTVFGTIAAGPIGGLSLSGTLLCAADESAGLLVLDVSSPGSPALVGGLVTPGTAQDVVMQGSRAYVADGVMGLQVVDVSNPTAPTIAGTFDTPRTARGVYVDGTNAYVADSTGGLHVIDVDPSQPALLRSFDTREPARGVAASSGQAIVATELGVFSYDGLVNAPPLIGWTSAAGPIRDLAAQGEVAYAISDAAGLQVIHAGPLGLQVVGATDPAGVAISLDVSDNHALLITDTLLQVVDVSNPAAPFLVSSFDPPTTLPLKDIGVWHGHAYVIAAGPNADDELLVIDVDPATSPACIATRSYTGELGQIHVGRDHAYVNGRTSGDTNWYSILCIANPSDPYPTSLISGFGLGDLAIGPRRLSVDSFGSLVVYDLADPGYPTGAEYLDMDVSSLEVLGNYVYTSFANPAFGFSLVDVSAAEPVLVGTVDTPGKPGMVATTPRYAFVSTENPNGVAALPLQCDPETVGAPGLEPVTTMTALRTCVPNPFRESTTISYEVGSGRAASLTIYDVSGRLVRSIVLPRPAAGRHQISWDGRNDAGREVSAGTYYVRLQDGAREVRGRMTRIR